jgi:hypothetical protein
MSKSMQDIPAQSQRFDEFSPGKFILQVQNILRYILRKWYVVALAGLVAGGGAWMYYGRTGKTMYIAEMSFAIDEEISRQKKSGLSEITEQLGLGPSDAGLLYTSESNIAALLMSRLMIESTLRKPVPGEKPGYTYADFFLDSLRFRQKWIKNAKVKTASFTLTPSSTEAKLHQNSLVAQMHDRLTSKYLKIDKKLTGSNILSVSCVTEHELFSKLFLEELVANVTQHYIEAQTMRAKTNLNAIEKRIDSVQRAYSTAMYGKAANDDANINLVRQQAIVSGARKQTDIEVLRAAYVELSLSLESAKTSLLKSTPVIQVLDAPLLPLKTNAPNIMKKTALFFVGGAFLAGACLGLAALYRRLMAQG